MGLKQDFINACKDTVENIKKLELFEGRKPNTIAGVVIYMIN